MEFFRHCPACGRRFHIKVEARKLVDAERTSWPTKNVTNITGPPIYSAAPPVFMVQEGKPIVIDKEVFQYTLKCNHCQHEWTEKRVEKHEEK